MLNIEEYFDGLHRGKKKQGIESIQFLMGKYKNFEKNMKYIHIAGTNGKGSCTEIMTNILMKQGYKVGKFLTPHLIKYNERISINNQNISDNDLSDMIEELQPHIDEYYDKMGKKISYFELLTFIGLLYFYRNDVDFVVLETGLGGENDATNIISKPLVSIITSIGYDHMRILGDSLEQIASQKAGIIKENSNTIIFKQTLEVDNVFIKKCAEKNNNLIIVDQKNIKNYELRNDLQFFDYNNFKKIIVNLKGKVQIKNASLCIEAVNVLNKLGYTITEQSLRAGLMSVTHPARMEVLCQKPLVIYDGAHNEPAINSLLETVKEYYPKAKRRYIISILKRKDYVKMIELLSKDKEALFVLTSGNGEDKFATAEDLYDVALKYIPKSKLIKKNLEDAVLDAINGEENIVNFIIGTFYVYGDVLQYIKDANMHKK